MFLKELFLEIEIWRRTLGMVIHVFLAKLFSLVQVPIFLACTVFHPFFFAFSWEELGRLKFPCFPDSRFHSYLVIHYAQCGFAMILNGVLFLEATNLSSLY